MRSAAEWQFSLWVSGKEFPVTRYKQGQEYLFKGEHSCPCGSSEAFIDNATKFMKPGGKVAQGFAVCKGCLFPIGNLVATKKDKKR